MAERQNSEGTSTRKERNYKSVKKKTSGFFSAQPETPYDREMELNFLSRYYRELCLTVMGMCMVAFGLALTIVAIERNIFDLYIIGPVPLVIGLVLLVFATGYTVKRCIDRPRIGVGIHFVESPDRLFLTKRTSVLATENEALPSTSKGGSQGGNSQPKSCLRKTSVTAVNSVRTSPGKDSPRLARILARETSYTEFPASPICTLPEVGGHDGESYRSTPEHSNVTMEELEEGPFAESDDHYDPYPPEGALASASPIDVLPPAVYQTPP